MRTMVVYLRVSSLADLTQSESGNRFLRRLFYCPDGWKGRNKMANKANLRICLVISMFFLVMAGPAQGVTITVGSEAGYDFDTIQAGIDAAVDGDTVLVAPGEYIITEPITFRGKAITVKSEAGPDETTIRMGTPADTNRGSVVVFENNETTASVLDGFTITGGTGSWLQSQSAWVGGGIYFNVSSATVRNCAIVQNSTEHGGGVMGAHLCSPRLIDCTIAENSASVSGGGVFTWEGCSMTLTNCIISGNSSIDGGGIMNWENSSVTMTDCIIMGNSATGLTVLVNGYGGGLYCGTRCLLTAINCNIAENSAGVGGGGVMCYQNSLATLTDCVITENSARVIGGGIECTDSSVTLTNCAITRNSSLSWGGGLSCHDVESFVTVSNCSIWGNSANQEGGGVGCFNGASAIVTNSIFLGNTAARGNEIFLEQAPTEFSVAYSNVAGGQAEIHVQGGALKWGAGNIDADPLFADAEKDDFHLKSEAGRWDPNSQTWVLDDVTSLCIDAGDPNSDWTAELWPHGERINMGAYGGTSQASRSLSDAGNVADLNRDGIVDSADMRIMVDH